jgi:hypothetical protein
VDRFFKDYGSVIFEKGEAIDEDHKLRDFFLDKDISVVSCYETNR